MLQVGIDGLFAIGSVALAATGIGILASIGLGAAMGLGQYAIASGLHGEQMTWQGALLAVGIGAVSGAISGYGARHIKSVVGNMADDVGGTGLKAITTAANRYAAGEISQKGFQAVLNLFGKSTFAAIQAATPAAIAAGFTSSAVKIFIMSAIFPIGNYYINKGLDYVF